LITAPLALTLFGASIQYGWHWIVPTVALGLMNFSLVVGTNVAIVYAIDCYKPVGNEVVTAIFGYKSAIGFILSFYTNPWITAEGYLNAYGEMAGIAGFFFLLVIPMVIWGKSIRRSSLRWRATSYIRWHKDRDDLVIEDDEEETSQH
jgi:hypothetical protein